jgi:hypothetical protein
MTTMITIQLRTSGPSADDVESVGRLAARFGGTLAPMVAHTRDSKLQHYFMMELPDAARAEEAANALRQHAAVAAAYIKPADAAP